MDVAADVIAQAVARLRALPGLMADSQVRDEDTGKKRLRFDTSGHQFTGASGLQSALDLAGRSGTGLRDARKTMEALDRAGGILAENLATTLGHVTGADTAAADDVVRSSDPR